jgi:hypothetical protein
LETEVSQNPFNGARADREIILLKFLRNNFGGNVGVQESVPHHLMNNFPGTTIVAFRTTAVTYEPRSAKLMKEGAELKVALLTETKLSGCAGRTIGTTFSFNKHGQFSGNLIIAID